MNFEKIIKEIVQSRKKENDESLLLYVDFSPKDKEIHLLEVTDTVVYSGEILTFTFKGQADEGESYKLYNCLINHREYQEMVEGKLEKPEWFDENKMKKYSFKKQTRQRKYWSAQEGNNIPRLQDYDEIPTIFPTLIQYPSFSEIEKNRTDDVIPEVDIHVELLVDIRLIKQFFGSDEHRKFMDFVKSDEAKNMVNTYYEKHHRKYCNK